MIIAVHPEAGDDSIAPAAYLKHSCLKLSHRSEQAKEIIRSKLNTSAIAGCLIKYLSKIERSKEVTFYALQYYHYFLYAWNTLEVRERHSFEDFHQKLLEVDFNDLSYFLVYQEYIETRLEGLNIKQQQELINREFVKYPSNFENSSKRCFPQFPSLASMIKGFLSERRSMIKNSGLICADVISTPKLTVNLPVSQIALFVKLFYQAGLFSDGQLTDLFKLISGAVSSKKQDHISKGSLSKEFYSVNQVTAGRVLDRLQQMVKQVKHDFFPD